MVSIRKDYLNKKLVLLIFILLFSSFFKTTTSCNQQHSPDDQTPQILKSEYVIGQQETAKSFSIIVLTDTQHYSQHYPQIFTNQTQWIVDNAADLNMVFVPHLGDLVQNGNSVSQWENAARSMNILNEGRISWEVLPGNHDFYGDVNLVNYNAYFGFGNFSGKNWFGGTYPTGTNNNNFAFFSCGDDDYLIFSFQYHPNDLVLAWANETIGQYPERRVIVATHDYLDLDGERRPEGNHIWNSLVAPHADQVFLVLCGHMHGEAHRTDEVKGHRVHQLLADYQDRPNGGNGWLRILEFHPTGDKILVKTFSPYLNIYENDVNSTFSLDYDMAKSTRPSLTPPCTPAPEPESSEEQTLALYAICATIVFLAIGLIVFIVRKK